MIKIEWNEDKAKATISKEDLETLPGKSVSSLHLSSSVSLLTFSVVSPQTSPYISRPSNQRQSSFPADIVVVTGFAATCCHSLDKRCPKTPKKCRIKRLRSDKNVLVTLEINFTTLKINFTTLKINFTTGAMALKRKQKAIYG